MSVLEYEFKRVLIVEDDEEIRDVLRNFLSELGFQTIFEAKSGFDALKFMDSDYRGADLVICDWNMPGMSGYSVFKQFKTTHPKMPFIMVTSRGDYDSIQMAKEAGIQSYLMKPVSVKDLSQKVTHALRH